MSYPLEGKLKLNLRSEFARSIVVAEQKGLAGFTCPRFDIVGERVAVGENLKNVAWLKIPRLRGDLQYGLGTF